MAVECDLERNLSPCSIIENEAQTPNLDNSNAEESISQCQLSPKDRIFDMEQRLDSFTDKMPVECELEGKLSLFSSIENVSQTPNLDNSNAEDSISYCQLSPRRQIIDMELSSDLISKTPVECDLEGKLPSCSVIGTVDQTPKLANVAEDSSSDCQLPPIRQVFDMKECSGSSTNEIHMECNFDRNIPSPSVIENKAQTSNLITSNAEESISHCQLSPKDQIVDMEQRLDSFSDKMPVECEGKLPSCSMTVQCHVEEKRSASSVIENETQTFNLDNAENSISQCQLSPRDQILDMDQRPDSFTYKMPVECVAEEKLSSCSFIENDSQTHNLDDANVEKSISQCQLSPRDQIVDMEQRLDSFTDKMPVECEGKLSSFSFIEHETQTPNLENCNAEESTLDCQLSPSNEIQLSPGNQILDMEKNPDLFTANTAATVFISISNVETSDTPNKIGCNDSSLESFSLPPNVERTNSLKIAYDGNSPSCVSSQAEINHDRSSPRNPVCTSTDRNQGDLAISSLTDANFDASNSLCVGSIDMTDDQNNSEVVSSVDEIDREGNSAVVCSVDSNDCRGIPAVISSVNANEESILPIIKEVSTLSSCNDINLDEEILIEKQSPETFPLISSSFHTENIRDAPSESEVLVTDPISLASSVQQNTASFDLFSFNLQPNSEAATIDSVVTKESHLLSTIPVSSTNVDIVHHPILAFPTRTDIIEPTPLVSSTKGDVHRTPTLFSSKAGGRHTVSPIRNVHPHSTVSTPTRSGDLTSTLSCTIAEDRHPTSTESAHPTPCVTADGWHLTPSISATKAASRRDRKRALESTGNRRNIFSNAVKYPRTSVPTSCPRVLPSLERNQPQAVFTVEDDDDIEIVYVSENRPSHPLLNAIHQLNSLILNNFTMSVASVNVAAAGASRVHAAKRGRSGAKSVINGPNNVRSAANRNGTSPSGSGNDSTDEPRRRPAAKSRAVTVSEKFTSDDSRSDRISGRGNPSFPSTSAESCLGSAAVTPAAKKRRLLADRPPLSIVEVSDRVCEIYIQGDSPNTRYVCSMCFAILREEDISSHYDQSHDIDLQTCKAHRLPPMSLTEVNDRDCEIFIQSDPSKPPHVCSICFKSINEEDIQTHFLQFHDRVLQTCRTHRLPAISIVEVTDNDSEIYIQSHPDNAPYACCRCFESLTETDISLHYVQFHQRVLQTCRAHRLPVVTILEVKSTDCEIYIPSAPADTPYICFNCFASLREENISMHYVQFHNLILKTCRAYRL